MKSTVLTRDSCMNAPFRRVLLHLALLAALGLGAPIARGAASLTATPSRIWLGESVQVTVGATGWLDSLTGETNSAPSKMGSGYWMFPPVTTSDNQAFNNLWSNTNTYTFGYCPSVTGTNSITADSITVTGEVVPLTGILLSPNPVPVGSNVTFTVDFSPAAAPPPNTLEWSTNITGSGTSASQTWTNWGTYLVESWDPALGGIYESVSIPIFAVVGVHADFTAVCCGASGGTNSVTAEMQPGLAGFLISWSGGPVAGSDTGESISVGFTNPGISVITATCGSSSFSFTNVLVRTEIDPLLKTNYVAYGGTSMVTLNLSTLFQKVRRPVETAD